MRVVNPTRIARSLVTVLFLTLLQIGIAPVLSPAALAYTQGTVTAGTAYGGGGGSVNAANQNCSNAAIVAIGATKSGENLNTFMFICKALNNDASLGATEVTTNVMGTPAESDRCDTGQIGIGIRVIASNGGSLVGGVGLICGNPMSQGNPNTRSIMPNASSAGTVYTYTCAAGRLLAGFALRTGALVDQITPKCSTFTGFNYSAVGAPTATVTGNAASVSFSSVTGSIADTALTYTVNAVPNVGSTITVTGATSPITVPNLVMRSIYTITVTASNAYGSSPATSNTSASMAIPISETDVAMTGSSTKFAYTSDFSKIMPGTVSLYSMQSWLKPSSTCDGAYYCSFFTNTGSFYYNIYNGKVAYIIGSGSAWCDGGNFTYPSNTFVKSGQWSHIGIVRNGANVKIFINGALKSDVTHSCSPTTQTSNTDPFGIGYTSGFDRYFYGSIDDPRIWSTDRSATMASDMNSNETSTSGLMHYWNFNEGTGTVAYDQVPGADAGDDLVMYSSNAWDADVVSTTTYDGAYTVETFYKSYLTAIGGFKMPAPSTRALALVVAGGGGGGGGLQGGGGGAGGFLETTTSLVSGSIYPITVGVGGVGSGGYTYRATTPSNGLNSSAFGMTAIGGGYGGSEYVTPNEHFPAASGGSGGGGTWGNTSSYYAGKNGTAGQGNKGGDNLTQCCIGAGGGGAGGVGANTTSTTGGSGGVGKLSLITGSYLAGGGGGAFRDSDAGGIGGTGGGGASATSRSAATHKTGGAQAGGAATGGGGGGSLRNTSNTDGFGANGGSGIVAIRWITASKPTYTAPTIAYLNAGMTETFTTNVAQDSATVSLTRTFRWESSTTGVNGTYSVIKHGTGANNAFFAWVPTNTSTSGSTYAYRVVITDSDSSGLFIVDTSTPVWAIINQPLNVTGNGSIGKAINLSKSETFTITLGTSTYRSTLTPDAPGISLDISTAGLAIIKISETVTVGTYYETLTVTDSVSASVTIPLTINVAAAPSLINSSEIVTNDLLLHFDAGNSQSLITSEGSLISTNQWKDIAGSAKNAQTSGTFNSGACQAPSYSEEFGGSATFNGTNQCLWVPYLGSNLRNSVTVEAWFKTPSTTIPGGVALFGQAYPTSTKNIDFHLGSAASTNTDYRFGMFNGSNWQSNSSGYTPTANTWTHLVGTYDGADIKLYVNGALLVSTPNTTSISAATGTQSLAGYFIGRRFDGTSYFNGSIASLRVYDLPLSLNQVQQNFNATKDRFITTGAVQTKFSLKYGSYQSESYTVTSGYGSKTSSFAIGDRTGIDWDTRTATSLTLNIQESLTVGTYLDTATVTDSLGQSTYLPVRVTISKADTITVTLRNPKILTYTGSAAASLPDIGFTGLKNSDTATVVRLYSAPASSAGAPETYTALINSSVVPRDVESYTVSLGTIVFNVGSLSNYEGVTYETSTLKILQAEQPDLRLPPYGATVGAPYTFVVDGGAGGGAISESVTAGSSASGCSITNHVLTMTSTNQSYCSVLITKAQSRNYKAETLTAQIYFYAFVINQPSEQIGSGPNIALNGQTSVTLDPYQAPTITSLSHTSISLASIDSLTITGAGFTTSAIKVKFWRNKEVTVTSTNGTTLVIPFSAIAAAGATTGRIIVTSPNGQAVSVDTLTINP